MQLYDSSIAARLYDLQHEDDPLLEEEKGFILEQAEQTAGLVADLGCGTGRILLEAAAKGLPIVGCDRSGAFLRRLQEKAQEEGLEPVVWRSDLSNLSVREESIALAFAAFRTFDHLVEPGAQREFLESAFQALEPGGRLLVNVANPEPMNLEAAMGQKVLMRDDIEDPVTGLRVVWWGATRFFPETAEMIETSAYDFVDASGRVVESYHFSFPMRWTPCEEMREMAAAAGFEVADCWSGFQQDPFEVGTGDAVWDLRKSLQ